MDILPRSKLSYIVLGIFFLYGLNYAIPNIQTLIFSGIFFVLHLVLLHLHKSTKWVYKFSFRYFTIGILIGGLLYFFTDSLRKVHFDAVKEFISNNANEDIELHPIRKIQGNIWLFELTSKEINKQQLTLFSNKATITVPVQFNPKIGIQSVSCPMSMVSHTNTNIKKYIDTILKNYGGHLFLIPYQGCKEINSIPPHELVKRTVSNHLKLGGIKEEMHGVAMALIFGDSSYLSRETYNNAKLTGTLHLFAASGLHIGILIGSLFLIGRHLFRLGYYGRLIFPMGFAYVYLYLLSFPVSLSRAYFFAMIIVFSKMVFRKSKPIDMILISSCAILLFKPESFLSLGFLLSYMAIVGIFFLKPRIDHVVLPVSNNWKILTGIRDNLSLTLSANLGTLPVVWIYFEGFSYGSIFTNFILVPITGIILPFLYLSLSISLVSIDLLQPLVQIFFSLTDLLLRILLGLNEYFSYSIGFYRIWNTDGHEFYILGLMLLSIIVIATFIKKIKYHPIILRGFIGLVFVCGFITWFVYGYRNNSPIDEPKKLGLQFYSDNSIIWLEETGIHIGGYCKYDSYKLKNSITSDLCRVKDKIYIDHGSCMPFVRFCLKENNNIQVEFGSKYLKDWSIGIPEKQWMVVTKRSTFQWEGQRIFFYKLGFDPVWLPRFLNRKLGSGTIIIQNPKSNPIGKKLGFWDGWRILSIDNDSISLLQSESNTRNLNPRESKP